MRIKEQETYLTLQEHDDDDDDDDAYHMINWIIILKARKHESYYLLRNETV